jgi:hypothetical protein
MNPSAISIQAAVAIGALVGFIAYHVLLRKKIEEAFQKGCAFGLKEGFECGFPQGVVLAGRNFREELRQVGVVFDKEINIEQTRPGLYKIQTFVEVTRPGQDSVIETPAPQEI